MEARLILVPALGGIVHSTMIRGLNTYTEYNIWVSASTNAAEGPYSDVVAETTNEDGMSILTALNR